MGYRYLFRVVTFIFAHVGFRFAVAGLVVTERCRLRLQRCVLRCVRLRLFLPLDYVVDCCCSVLLVVRCYSVVRYGYVLFDYVYLHLPLVTVVVTCGYRSVGYYSSRFVLVR
jgi:hypothetical protein